MYLYNSNLSNFHQDEKAFSFQQHHLKKENKIHFQVTSCTRNVKKNKEFNRTRRIHKL